MRISELSPNVEHFLSNVEQAAQGASGIAVVVLVNGEYHSYQWHMATEDLFAAAKLLRMFAKGPTLAEH